jgi:hypothetical protein
MKKGDSADPETETLGVYAMKSTAYAEFEEQIKKLPETVNFEKDTPDHVIVSFDGTKIEYELKEHEVTEPFEVKVGDKIKVQGIEMACTSVQSGLENDVYYFVYFNAGELKEYKFNACELVILGAEKL